LKTYVTFKLHLKQLKGKSKAHKVESSIQTYHQPNPYWWVAPAGFLYKGTVRYR